MQSKTYVYAFLSLFLFSSIPYLVFIGSNDPIPWIGFCNPSGYDADHYLAHCIDTRYGNYEHWAFLNNKEGTGKALAAAEVIFLGNSRTQYAFSTTAVEEYFQKNNILHYLLGFSHAETDYFPRTLLKRLSMRPGLMVINADPFFSGKDSASEEAKHIIKGGVLVELNHVIKHEQQGIQYKTCRKTPGKFVESVFCGSTDTIFRNRLNGHWLTRYANLGDNKDHPVTYDGEMSAEKLQHALDVAEKFLSETGMPRECVVLTVTPRVGTDVSFGKELAFRLGTPGIFLTLPDLNTLDRSHLDSESAERWSGAFLEELDPYLKNCL